MKKLKSLLWLLLLLQTCWLPADQPGVMLAIPYQQLASRSDINVADYLVSEKLDGVRARWDGSKLVSRNGNIFAAPDWFTAGFADKVMDGELWSSRGEFQTIASIVLKKTPHPDWRRVKFWIFDLPLQHVMFAERVEQMQQLVDASNSPYLRMIEQVSVADNFQLMQKLDQAVAQNAEGLMLHKKTALYQNGRSNDLLKLKKYQDAEATVLAYKAGKGKFKGMLGSLKVASDSGAIFYVGSGFSDVQRKNPPAVGSRITFRYQGLTNKGIPRFPVFLRIRSAE